MPVDFSQYVDVAERIATFREKHPEGSLQPADKQEPFSVLTLGDQAFIVYAAAAYRHPEDRRPGIGLAYEPFPGRTPYTKDSELQNAETSAWGRAIVAVLAADTKRGIATSEDVRNRSVPSAPAVAPLGQIQAHIDAFKGASETVQAAQSAWGHEQGIDPRHPTVEQLKRADAHLAGLIDEEIAEGGGADTREGSEPAAPVSISPTPALPDAGPELDLAATPCERCGSARTKRALVGDHVRCTDAKGCDERAAVLI